MKVSYDEKHDILYVSIKPGVPSYGEEDVRGIIVRREPQSDSMTGITIMDYSKKDPSFLEKHSPLPIKWRELREEILVK